MDELIKNKRAAFSVEVFPPKSDEDVSTIYAKLDKFAVLSPDYMSVTYGAGGGTSALSGQIASHIVKKYGIACASHLTCVNSTRQNIDAVLDDFEQKGIKHILALRGDIVEGRVPTDFLHASDLIKYISKRGGFTLSAAAYVEGHPESKSFEQDLDVLKMKYELGVKHFITQLFFDNDDMLRLLERLDKMGIRAKIDAGIMPLTSTRQIERTVKLSGTKIPEKLAKLIAKYGEDEQAFRAAGLDYALTQSRELLGTGVCGVHIYAMNAPSVAKYLKDGLQSQLDALNGGR